MDNAGAERVVIKLGGGLLTEKSNLCTAKHEVIADIAAAIAELDRRGISVIIVHGAGSNRALRWDNTGYSAAQRAMTNP